MMPLFAKIQYKIMEKIHVIDIEQMVNVTKKCVEHFAFFGEAASVLTELDQPETIRKTAKVILTKLIGGKLSRDEVSRSTIFAHLRQLVGDILLHVVSESMNNQNCDKANPGFDETKLALTVKTIDESLKKKLLTDTKCLEKLIQKHEKSVKDVQNVQKKYWTINSKFNKYQIMVDTAIKSRQHLQSELSKKEIQARDKAIKELELSLNTNRTKSEEIGNALLNLKNKEEILRNEIKKECASFIHYFVMEIGSLIQSGLNGLKNTVDKLIQHSLCRDNLLQQIQGVDVDYITSSLAEACSWTYVYPKYMSCVDANGFQTKIPDTCRENICPDILMKPNTAIKQRDYVELVPNAKPLCPEFLDGTKGFQTKRKMASKDCAVEFGWTRQFPLSRKIWGYFKKENVV